MRGHGGGGGVIHGLVRTARPKQWVKNILVFAAPGAAGVLDDWPELGYALLAFVAFCLAASGIYFWNDALDIDADRLHPTKRFRPIAAGTLPAVDGEGRRDGAGRRLARRRRRHGALADRRRRRRLHRHDDGLQRLAQARGRRRHRHHRRRLRAAGGRWRRRRRRRRCRAGSCCAPSSARCSSSSASATPSCARWGRRRRPCGRRSATTASATSASCSPCPAARRSSATASGRSRRRRSPAPTCPYYELSIVPMLTALLRYALGPRAGRGRGAGGGVRQRPRAAGARRVWVVVFGLGVYLQ